MPKQGENPTNWASACPGERKAFCECGGGVPTGVRGVSVQRGACKGLGGSTLSVGGKAACASRGCACARTRVGAGSVQGVVCVCRRAVVHKRVCVRVRVLSLRGRQPGAASPAAADSADC